MIGGGPSGLSAALGLARRGFSVQVFYQQKEWKGRVCGAFLSPEALHHLQWLGLLKKVEERGAPCTHVTIFNASSYSSTIPIVQNGTPGLALTRKELEEVLLEEARRQGVLVRKGTRVTGISKNGRWQVQICGTE